MMQTWTMVEDDTFHDLIVRLRAGDQEAQSDVYNQFVRRLIGLARKQLDSRIRQKVDPEDIVQSAFLSFFRRQADGQFDPQTENSLWRLLAHITLCKCRNRADYFQAARRDVRLEVSAARDSVDSHGAWQGFARDPTPSDAAILHERIEELMSGLNDRGRAILALSLQGSTISQISLEVGRSERTVRGVLEQVKKRLQGMLDEAMSG